MSEGSYLIRNRVKMPLFGKAMKLVQRTKTSISKRLYLKNKQLFNPFDVKKYVLDLTG